MAITELTHGTVKKITYEWTSHAATGDAEETTTKAYNGAIERLVTVPGTAGDQPADNYDVTVEDSDEVDVLMGEGANRSDTTTQQVGAGDLGVVAYSRLTFKIDNAGNSNKGTVHLYIR